VDRAGAEYYFSRMTITIELPPEIEANLLQRAAAEGLSLQEYLRRLLEQHTPSPGDGMTSRQRADLWRQSTAGLPQAPPLSDEAVARDTIYGARG